jgi:hypothetical protein
MNMNRNIKYKQVCRIGLFGDDDANTTTNSQYNVFPSSIPAITVVSGGSNYTAAATTILLLNDNNSGFLATPTISGGVITSITINNGGSNYMSTPNVVIASGISSTTNLVGGTGYTNGTYQLGISGGDGSGGVGTYTVTGNVVASISITTPGRYNSAPTLSFPLGGGTGASATAVIGTNAVANVTGVFTNAKRMRFTLNNGLNDLRLSQNARCVVETCNIPSFQNMAGRYALVRLVVSSQDKTYDTKKNLNGNPILLSMATQATLGSTNVLYNASEFFYNVNVPPNIFSQGYIDIELEIPSATANIDFITNKPLSTFFLNLIVVDEDLELTQDLTLAPPIDYKTYNVNMPIRPY